MRFVATRRGRPRRDHPCAMTVRRISLYFDCHSILGSRFLQDHSMATTATKAQAPRTGAHRFFGREAWLGYALILPLLLVMIGLLAYPVVNALLISLQDK